MLLELNHVAYTYITRSQSVAALKDATASFAAGGLYAVVGKSGSGKSTLLSLIAGLMLPTGGEVRYDGVTTREMDLNRYRRDQVTVIYQSFNLFPLLTALENVAYPLELKGLKPAQARAEAARHIASVGLADDLQRRFPDQLSGGERQRVAIARALATGSRLILADEPTGNLDEASGAVVIDLLADLARHQQVTVILVTHDRDIARLADEIYQMRDGVLFRNGPPDEASSG